MKEIIQKPFVSLHTSELTNDLNAEDPREHTRKHGTSAEIGNMNVITFTVSLIFRNERFNNLHKTSKVETCILITHLPLPCCVSHGLFGPQACNMRKKAVMSLTGTF